MPKAATTATTRTADQVKAGDLKKQQNFKARMKALGFTPTQVQVHADDRERLCEYARKLRKARGYGGQQKYI